ncbi:MAG TPA: class I SAM-dependent methyltransferase [bacterium]
MFQKDYWERKALDDRRSPDHPVVRQYVEPKIRLIRRFVPIDQDTRLLDVGCGNGFFSVPFEKICQTVGVDFSEKMLAKNPIQHKLLMDAQHLSFQDMAFDVVFCHALLHHVDDIDGVLKQMRRVSRKYVVILEPNRNNPLMFLFSALVPEERKAKEFSLSYLKGKLVQNQLKVVAAFSQGMTVPNKTPLVLLPLLKLLDFSQPLGMTNILIAER